MPHYFFHVLIDGGEVPDPDGRTLPDADAAWEAARRMALDLMASDLGRPVAWHRSVIAVRNSEQETVFEFPFLEAAGGATGPA